MADNAPPSAINSVTNNIRTDGIIETPRSHRSHAGKIALTDLRPIIAIEMDREFVRLPVNAFIKAYLPPVPSDDMVERVVREMSDSSYQGPVQDPSVDESSPNEEPPSREEENDIDQGSSLMLKFRGRMVFRAYPHPPTKSDGSEKEVYAPLVEISDEISRITNTMPGRQRNEFHYRDVSTRYIASDIEGSNNKIDAGFIRGTESSKPATHDIAVVIEQKLSVQARAGNNRQAVSANVQIMNDDVRRMFTFGITIESDQVTLWYHSRSHSAISEQFSIVRHARLLLKVFASFLYATTEELGYDRHIDYLGKGRYLFNNIPDVSDPSVLASYQTINTISEIRANNITGRMSRVFTVVKYDQKQTNDEKKKRFVLKDVWIDERAQTERQLQDAIFDDIDKFWSSSETAPEFDSIKNLHKDLVTRKGYKKSFLSIVGDYHGEASKPLVTGFQPVRGLLVGPPLEDEKAEPASNIDRIATHKTNHTMPMTTDLAYADFAPEEFVRTYTSKRQYRAVFNEVCNTVGRLDTLGEVIDVLRQSLTPLQLMLCAGWVHRDISSGNIMAYRQDLDNIQEPWQVILADLEYAKKYPPPANHETSSDPKTGTPFFMPIEIMMRNTLFEQDYEDSLAASANPKNDKKEPAVATTSGTTTVKKKKESLYKQAAKKVSAEIETKKEASKGVVHNFQHDLESIWWIILWTITSRVAWGPAQFFVQHIFLNTIRPSPQRVAAFRRDIRQALNECLPGKLTEPFAKPMESIRRAMYMDYVSRVREEKLKDVSSFAEISEAFWDFLEDIGKSSDQWSTTRLSAHNPFIDQAGRKRPLSNDDSGPAGQNQKEIEPKSKMAKTGDSAEGKQRAE